VKVRGDRGERNRKGEREMGVERGGEREKV